ncbi:hypothetical protein C2845_PM14G06070 [Panicum miliaceum]|uniref:Uncharacterized protein n=1 Tax=Panicum miliaceum TaxID=4540 RepID=A0A3L6PQW1_PANMI|nr:hypothetical protein C2845_PM14G06070 [Panicum miliaceum]
MDAVASTMLAAAVAILAAVVVPLPVLRRLLAASAGEKTKRRPPLPPGSFVLPVVGQTLSYLRALRANTAEEWLRRRAAAYGPRRGDGRELASMARMVGRRTIRDVAGDEHRRVRAMMAQFLRPDAVKRCVAAMDAEVRRHLDAGCRGRATVAVMPSMKSLTFDVMCTAIFGLARGADDTVRRELSTEFQQLVRGISVIPLDLPFTAFRKCLATSRRGRRAVAGVIEERRDKLARGESSPADDVVTHMLAEGLPDEEIIDNVMFLMIAAHDTTASCQYMLCLMVCTALQGNTSGL